MTCYFFPLDGKVIHSPFSDLRLAEPFSHHLFPSHRSIHLDMALSASPTGAVTGARVRMWQECQAPKSPGLGSLAPEGYSGSFSSILTSSFRVCRLLPPGRTAAWLDVDSRPPPPPTDKTVRFMRTRESHVRRHCGLPPRHPFVEAVANLLHPVPRSMVHPPWSLVMNTT